MPGPTTHISSLANLHQSYCIQTVNAYDLRDALDCSTDLRHDEGDTMGEHFPVLMEKKAGGCSDWFFSNLASLGIQEPLVIIVRSDGRWQMDEGHHRLAWALLNNKDVPVIFDDSGADDDSHVGYMVSRGNVDAYHNTTAEDDFDLLDDVESAFSKGATDQLAHNTPKIKGNRVFVPAPRGNVKHRAGGRHRSRA